MSSAAARLSLVEGPEPSTVGPVEPIAQIGPRRRVALVCAACLTTLGLVLGLFCLFIFAGSNVSGAKGQRELLASFKQSLERQSVASGPPVTAVPVQVAAGEPLGIIRIPAVSLQVLLIEGTRPVDLEKGPGHLRGTPLPGRKGNVVVAGRRATYGSAFGRLNELTRGDRIELSTLQGKSTYVVTGKKVVEPGKADVIGRTGDDRLTLITSHPRFIANRRLAITATLEGAGRPNPADAGPLVVSREEAGLAGDNSALGPLVIWAELFVAVLVFAWMARRRWPGRAIYLLSAPVLLALMYALFTQISRLLPATI